MRRVRIPRILIAALGAIAAAVLSFFLVFDPARVTDHSAGVHFCIRLSPDSESSIPGIVYGALILPRDAADPATRLSLRHWAVLLPLALMASGTGRSFGEPSAVAKRELEPQVIWVTWNPGLEPLTVKPFDMSGDCFAWMARRAGTPGIHIALTEVEIDRLQRAGAAGKMTMMGGIRNKQTSRGRCILILHQQVQEPFDYSSAARGCQRDLLAILLWLAATASGCTRLDEEGPPLRINQSKS